ncbi:MAG: serine/threonine-protein kinase [Polyangiales bacterium]
MTAQTTATLEAALEERESAFARIGSTIDDAYRLEMLIGVGGMASVYAATTNDGERVAIKIARRYITESPRACERFLAERELAGRVKHPAGVPIFAAGYTDDGAPFLAMELLEGESLASRWRRTPRFSIFKALVIAERLLDFIAACHAVGVVHRDLKPENVFLTHPGEVRVIDFGIAVAQDLRDGTRGRAVGTVAFMPPEQARGECEIVDGRADLFAIGAILWSLLSGHRLRAGRGALEIAARDPARSLVLVAPDVPPQLARLVDRALASDPEERWEDAAEMQAELARVLVSLADDPSVHWETAPMRALHRASTVPARRFTR